jgi:hypothetical protein
LSGQPDTGRRLFLAATGVALLTEALLAVAAAALFADPVLLLTGVFRVGFLLLLGRWTFTGSRRGKAITLAWVWLHVLITSAALLIVTTAPHWFPGVPNLEFGRVLPAIRICILSAFGLILLRSKSIQEFLAGQQRESCRVMSPFAYAVLGVTIISVTMWVVLADAGLTYSWRNLGP